MQARGTGCMISMSSISKTLSGPNVISFSRVLLSPIIAISLLKHDYVYSLSLFACAGASDWLDGWLARKTHTQSSLGSLLDPFADKVISFSVLPAIWKLGITPHYVFLPIIFKDGLLLSASIYSKYVSKKNLFIAPTKVSKFNTFLQSMYIANSIAVSIWDIKALALVLNYSHPVLFVTTFSTLISYLTRAINRI